MPKERIIIYVYADAARRLWAEQHMVKESEKGAILARLAAENRQYRVDEKTFG